ncbi:protein kinase domain-containing protein [Streptomyces sp. CA-243310]|uniref:protein kinase domain-containing protein n=1 Tax=Streptomyces sp. CA-243310 TaxID=3240056 RepID=UPI003D8F1BB0
MEGIVEQRAVKIYHARGSADQRRRALEEIRVQEQLLGCPHAVAYVDAFVAEDGPYAGCLVQVMELGDRSLGDHLAAEGPLPPGEATAALAGVAWALEDVHRRHLVHADVKPGNIVRCRGLWKIADFNVTAALRETAAWDLGGTYTYMSPRRMRSVLAGRPEVRPVDDLWALGIVLGECLLGELPMRINHVSEEESLRLADAVLAALPGAGTDSRTVDLVQQLLASDPARRPAAGAVAHRLRELATAATLAPTRPLPRAVFTVASYGDPHLEVFAADTRGTQHGWAISAWDGWYPMDAAGPGPVRALAAGSPETYRQHLWLLDHEGRLWRRALAVDRETFEPTEAWSPWSDVPLPGGATLTDIASAGAPWTAHRLYAVDEDGAARYTDRRDGGDWSDWSPVPGAPADLGGAAARGVLRCAGRPRSRGHRVAQPGSRRRTLASPLGRGPTAGSLHRAAPRRGLGRSHGGQPLRAPPRRSGLRPLSRTATRSLHGARRQFALERPRRTRLG